MTGAQRTQGTVEGQELKSVRQLCKFVALQRVSRERIVMPVLA